MSYCIFVKIWLLLLNDDLTPRLVVAKLSLLVFALLKKYQQYAPVHHIGHRGKQSRPSEIAMKNELLLLTDRFLVTLALTGYAYNSTSCCSNIDSATVNFLR